MTLSNQSSACKRCAQCACSQAGPGSSSDNWRTLSIGLLRPAAASRWWCSAASSRLRVYMISVLDLCFLFFLFQTEWMLSLINAWLARMWCEDEMICFARLQIKLHEHQASSCQLFSLVTVDVCRALRLPSSHDSAIKLCDSKRLNYYLYTGRCVDSIYKALKQKIGFCWIAR